MREVDVNSLLAEYLHLERVVKKQTKRIEELRKWLKEQGSFSTSLFVCAVKPRSRTAIVALDKVIDAIGKEILLENDLIQTTHFLVVAVSQKETQRDVG